MTERRPKIPVPTPTGKLETWDEEPSGRAPSSCPNGSSQETRNVGRLSPSGFRSSRPSVPSFAAAGETRIPLDRRAARAWGFAPDVYCAPAGAVLVTCDGTALRVTEAGGLDPVIPFGHRSIASDPTAIRG